MPTSASFSQKNGSQEPLLVGFLTTLGVNVGDDFIREGIRQCLDQSDVFIAPLFVNKHDPESLYAVRDIELTSVSDKILGSDLFIQSGAPVYWHHGPDGHRSTHAEWHSWAWEDRILRTDAQPVFLNLGAGSCQPWGDNGEAFLKDPECARFARRAGHRARITTVRDPVAGRILDQLGVAHHCLPCPAFLAAGNFVSRRSAGGWIGVNLMPKGGHFELNGTIDVLQWIRKVYVLLEMLRKMGPLVFICHDEPEELFARLFATGAERIFRSNSYRDYLDLFRDLSCMFANRVHAGVAAAGFGVPAIIAGTDTRVLTGAWLGLDLFYAGTLDPIEVGERMRVLLLNREAERERLVGLRERTLRQYADLLNPVLAEVRPGSPSRSPIAVVHPLRRWLATQQSASTWTERIGVEPLLAIGESGFHSPEPYCQSQLRWTDGHAKLTFPGELDARFSSMRLSLWPVHPIGHRFEVRIDGQTLLQAEVGPAGDWQGPVPLTPGGLKEIEIVSDVMRPAGEVRPLGVALRQIKLELLSPPVADKTLAPLTNFA